MSGLALEGWGGGGGAAIPNPLPVARGGTGAQDVAGVLAALGLAGAAPVNAELVRRFGLPILDGGFAGASWGAAPGFAPGAAVQRASAATAVVDGLLAEFAAGSARWADWLDRTNGQRALLLGGQRTNSVPNPRGEGAGGTPPTGWALPSPRGVTHTFTPATVDGVQGVVWSLSGTPNSTAGSDLQFEVGETLAPGLLVTTSVFHRLVSGVLPFSTLTLRLGSETPGTATPLTPTGALVRATNTVTAAGTAYRCRLGFAFPDTVTPVSCALFFGWPQREMGAAFASAPILPPAGTLAASTRLADALPALPVAGPATVLIECAVPTLPPAGSANMMLAQFDAGTDTDRIRVHLPAGGTSLVAGRVVGGVATDAAALGSVTAGGRFAVALRHDGAGTLGAAMTGGSVQTLGGGLAGVTSLLLCNNRAGASPLFGLVRQARLFPRSLSDAELLAAVA